MKNVMAATAAFQGEIRAVRVPVACRAHGVGEGACCAILESSVHTSDCARALAPYGRQRENADDWNWITDFIGKAASRRRRPGRGSRTERIRACQRRQANRRDRQLEALIVQSGPTPECLGLRGRYKRLYAKAAAPMEQMQDPAKSIEAYGRSMELDHNQEYCSSNLPCSSTSPKRRKRPSHEPALPSRQLS